MTADLPVGFWAGWVAVITVVSLLGLCWLVGSIYFSKKEHEANNTIWDENLREGNNPAPMWWFWMILAALIFSLVYLMLYPGLGEYKGILNWSQGGRLLESYESFEEDFGVNRSELAYASIEGLSNNKNAMASAGRIFKQHCAACHGATATGQADLFPDLTDGEWQWGGTEEEVELTIRHGRRAAMPAWGPVVGEDGVSSLSDYLMILGKAPPADSPGASLYKLYCVACHGLEGKGSPALGAPNLSNDIWLYGGTKANLDASIADGRSGVMPPFDARLDNTQIRLLVAWLLNAQKKSTSPSF